MPASPHPPPRLTLAAILTLGLILRLWFITHAPHITGDTIVYGGIARNWLEHGVYSFTRPPTIPRPTLIRLPGYPLFLAACFTVFGTENYHAVLLLQVAADLLTCTLVAATAHRLFDRRASIAALTLACLCPFTASYTAQPLTETLTLACIALAFYTLLRWQAAGAGLNRWLFPLSASLAYAILLRPEQGLLPAAILPAMLWTSMKFSTTDATTSALTQTAPQTRSPAPATTYPIPNSGYSQTSSHPPTHTRILTDNKLSLQLRAFAPVLLTALLTLLPLVPWTIRNARTFHIFQPLAPRSATDPGEFIATGFDRWYRTWAIDFASTEDVYWNYDGSPIALADLPARAFDTPQQQADTAALLDTYNDTSNATPALDTRFNALAADRTRAHPFRVYLALPIARVANMLFRPRTENIPWPTHWWRFHEHARQSSYALAYAALNLIYFLLAALALRRWLACGAGNSPLAWAMLTFLVLRLALLLTLDNSEPRYTLEFFPILILFAAPLISRSSSSRPRE